jgi:hypothetical protein
MNEPTAKPVCSFCGQEFLRGWRHGVHRTNVSVCRDCFGACLEMIAKDDPEWRDRKIETLVNLRDNASA